MTDRGRAGQPQLGLRVLVADDNPSNRILLQRLLDLLGCQWEAVTTGRAAVTAVEEGSFDVVLMDVVMPDMDGCEAAQAIRALDGPQALVPIIAVTGAAYRQDFEKTKAAGMNAHLAKPFMIEDLAEALLGCGCPGH